VCEADIRIRSSERRSSVSASARSSALKPSDPDRADAIRISWLREASLAGRLDCPGPATPIVFVVT
jgi:hypothetical protein